MDVGKVSSAKTIPSQISGLVNGGAKASQPSPGKMDKVELFGSNLAKEKDIYKTYSNLPVVRNLAILESLQGGKGLMKAQAPNLQAKADTEVPKAPGAKTAQAENKILASDQLKANSLEAGKEKISSEKESVSADKGDAEISGTRKVGKEQNTPQVSEKRMVKVTELQPAELQDKTAAPSLGEDIGI
jgi:hypothetical protein